MFEAASRSSAGSSEAVQSMAATEGFGVRATGNSSASAGTVIRPSTMQNIRRLRVDAVIVSLLLAASDKPGIEPARLVVQDPGLKSGHSFSAVFAEKFVSDKFERAFLLAERHPRLRIARFVAIFRSWTGRSAEGNWVGDTPDRFGGVARA